MNNITDFFSKDGIKHKIIDSDIQMLIDNQFEESLKLEYKEIRDNKMNIMKVAQEVAAFATAEGGLIIVGVSEKKKQLPEKITWYEGNINSEILTQKLNSKIIPKPIFHIYEVTKNDNINKKIFLIDVPQSDIAPHQVEYIYRTRLGKKMQPMEAYLVELFYNRRRKPVFKIRINGFYEESSQSSLFSIVISNIGRASAKNLSFSINFDKQVINHGRYVFKSDHPYFGPNYYFLLEKNVIIHPEQNIYFSRFSVSPSLIEKSIKFEMKIFCDDNPMTLFKCEISDNNSISSSSNNRKDLNLRCLD